MVPLLPQRITSPKPRAHDHLGDGDTCRACTADDDLEISHLLSCHLAGVEQACAGDDGRAVLVVVEHRDVTLFDQGSLDFKAPGSTDVLQIDAAEALGDVIYCVNNYLRILGIDTD